MNQRVRPRMGNKDEIMAPHNCYPCKGEDKWVAIAVETEEEWQGLCRVLGNPEWSKAHEFADQYSRWKNQDKLDKLISRWTINFTHYEIMNKLQDIGIAAGPSFDLGELVNDPHTRERNILIEQNHREAGKTIVYRSPWASAKTKDNPPAPCLGEHNQYVFGELLGISNDEMASLAAQEIIC